MRFKFDVMLPLSHLQLTKPPRWLRDTAFASHAGDRDSIPGRGRPKSLKQVGTRIRHGYGNLRITIDFLLINHLVFYAVSTEFQPYLYNS